MTDAGLDEDVLLPRSITSILHAVHPQAVGGSDSLDQKAGWLHRLALLFVAGDPGDVAAVTAANSKEGPGFEVLAVSDSDKPGARSDVSTPESGDDWMLHCLQFGPLSPQVHARQLQHLARQLHRSDHITAMGNLRRYVYFHCCPKVHTRLFATFPGRPPNEFGELIRGDHGLDFKSIYVYLKSLKDHKAPPPPPPPEVLASSEEWLAEKLRKAQAPGELEQCLNLDELGHLRRSPVTVAIVCDYMQGVLQVAEEAIKEGNAKGRARKLIDGTRSALDKLAASLADLSRLVHDSATFWYLLALKPFSDVVPVAVPEPATLDDGCDEEVGAHSSHADPSLFRGWFISLSQWYGALSTLDSDVRIVKFITTQDLEITMLSVPTPPYPNNQASLESTLNSFCHQADEVVEARKWLREAAASRGKTGPPSVGLLAEFDNVRWSTSFRGTVHCECALACMVKGRPHLKKIGASKRCCFAYFKFLENMRSFDAAPTHGRVYPWTPPSDATEDAKVHVLRALQEVLKAAIQFGRKSGDSHPGSDAGHHEPIQMKGEEDYEVPCHGDFFRRLLPAS